MNSDLEKLIQAAVYEGQTSGVDALTAALTASVAPLNSSRGAESGPEAIAIGAKQLVDAATSAALNTEGLSRKPSNSASSQERGLGETALRTAAMMTGVGPLVTGLMKLFGSDDPEPLPPLEKFSAPGTISVEAGLTRDREYSALRYAQGGSPEPLGGPNSRSGQGAAIQVNIQAMDSQSFIDRQDDIARAVREAMLNSNSLNDVVLEL